MVWARVAMLVTSGELYEQADLEIECDQCELFWEKIPGEPKFDHLDFL